MSTAALKWVWWIIQRQEHFPKSDQLTATERLILHTFAQRHNGNTGRCDPSIERIAIDIGLAERATQMALRKLEAKKVIKTIMRKKKGTKENDTSMYIFLGANEGCIYCTTLPHYMHPKLGNIPPPKKPIGYYDLIISEGED